MNAAFDTNVASARTAYNALTGAQRALVTNEADLTEAQAGVVTDELSLKNAIANASKIFIANDFTLNNPVDINQEVLVNGNGKVLKANVNNFAGATHNTVVVIRTNNVEITNLTVDSNATTPGTWQTPARFGMQVFDATGVKLTDITLKNGQAGLLVNAKNSDASVEGSGIDTIDNGFGGIEVYAEAGLTSTLTLTDVNHHSPYTTTPAIWSEGAGSINVNVPAAWYNEHGPGSIYTSGGNIITVPAGQTYWERIYM